MKSFIPALLATAAYAEWADTTIPNFEFSADGVNVTIMSGEHQTTDDMMMTTRHLMFTSKLDAGNWDDNYWTMAWFEYEDPAAPGMMAGAHCDAKFDSTESEGQIEVSVTGTYGAESYMTSGVKGTDTDRRDILSGQVAEGWMNAGTQSASQKSGGRFIQKCTATTNLFMQDGDSFPLTADNGMGAMKSEGAMATWGFKVWKAGDAEVKWAGNSEPMMWGITDFPMEPVEETTGGEGAEEGSGAITFAATATALAAMLLM